MATEPQPAAPPPPPPPVDRAAHNRAIATGVMWQGALRWLSQVLSWTATVMIARRLSPDDYGIAGTASVIVGLMSLVTDAGLGRALVLRRERDPMIIAQAHGAAMMLGASAALLMLLAAFPLARFYDDARVAPVVCLLALVPMISGLNTIPQAMMQQNLDYKRLAAMDFAKATVQATTVLLCALAGLRYWSLALGIVAGQIVATAIATSHTRVKPNMPQRRHLSTTLVYASHLVVSTLSWYLYSNSDFAVVGRVAGIAALGYYQFAWNIAQLPGEKLGNVLQSVVGPFFGSIGDDIQALRHYFLLLSELLVSIMLPVLCGFALVSPIAVPLLFGDKWVASIPIMQILVLCSAIGSLSQLSHHVLGATGQAAIGARMNLVAMVVLPIAFYVAARYSGVLAVASVWLVAQPFLVAYPLSRVKRTIQLSALEYIGRLRAPIVCTALMAGAVTMARPVAAEKLPPLLQLGALIGIGAVVYGASYWALFRQRVADIAAVWQVRASA